MARSSRTARAPSSSASPVRPRRQCTTFQSLTLNSGAALQVAGPVILTIAGSATINGTAGVSGSPGLLRLDVASGGVTVNSNGTLNGSVIAPSGTVIVNGTLNGGVIADRVIVHSNGILHAQEPRPQTEDRRSPP